MTAVRRGHSVEALLADQRLAGRGVGHTVPVALASPNQKASERETREKQKMVNAAAHAQLLADADGTGQGGRVSAIG